MPNGQWELLDKAMAGSKHMLGSKNTVTFSKHPVKEIHDKGRPAGGRGDKGDPSNTEYHYDVYHNGRKIGTQAVEYNHKTGSMHHNMSSHLHSDYGDTENYGKDKITTNNVDHIGDKLVAHHKKLYT